MNHNQERFAQLTGNSQVEFQQAWDELERFTNLEASQYFHNVINMQTVIDAVMCGDESIESWLIEIHNKPEMLKGIKNPWGYVKTMIKNRVKKLSDERIEKPAPLKESIIYFYAIGMKQSDIARFLECSKSHVSEVVKESTKEIEEIKKFAN